MCKLTELVFRERVFLFLVHYPASLNWGGGGPQPKKLCPGDRKANTKTLWVHRNHAHRVGTLYSIFSFCGTERIVSVARAHVSLETA